MRLNGAADGHVTIVCRMRVATLAVRAQPLRHGDRRGRPAPQPSGVVERPLSKNRH
jgi:hypothetical protein